MSKSKASLNSRYLKARLKPFTRPLFLGSLGMITFFSVCLWQYWQNPQWRSASLNAANSISIPNIEGLPQLNGDEYGNIYTQGIDGEYLVTVDSTPQPIEINTQRQGFLEEWLESKKVETFNYPYQPNTQMVTGNKSNQQKFMFSTEELLRQPSLQQYRTVLGNESTQRERVNNGFREENQFTTTYSERIRTQPTVLESAIARINQRNFPPSNRQSEAIPPRETQQPTNQVQAQNVPNYPYTGQPQQPPSGYTWGVTPPGPRPAISNPNPGNPGVDPNINSNPVPGQISPQTGQTTNPTRTYPGQTGVINNGYRNPDAVNSPYYNQSF